MRNGTCQEDLHLFQITLELFPVLETKYLTSTTSLIYWNHIIQRTFSTPIELNILASDLSMFNSY